MRTALPEHIFLLNGVTLDDQEAWYQKFWNWAKKCYEDDFIAFDGTQNEEFLGFHILIMQALGIPVAVIDNYVSWVTHLFGMLGEFGIFIASGFKPTWVFK